MTLSPLRRREAYTIAAIAALYLLLWVVLPKPSFWGLDNGFKFQGMRAFAESGRIVVPYAGPELGLDVKFRPILFPFGVAAARGQIPSFSPLFIVLGGMLFWLFGGAGSFLLPLCGGWGALLAAWRLWVSQRESHDGRPYLILVGLGSPLLFYSLELWEHTFAAALLTLALAFLCPGRKSGFKPERHAGALQAGLLVGLAAAFRSEAVVWVGIILLFWKQTGRSSQSAMRFAFGVGGALALTGLLNGWQTGTPLPLHIQTNLVAGSPNSLFGMVITRLQNGYALLVEGFKANHWSVLGLAPLLLLVGWGGWRRESGWWPYFALVILLTTGLYLANSIMSPNQVAHTKDSGGLLWVCPAAALALVPLRGERRRFWKLIYAGWLLFFLTLAAFSPTLEGIHWGPRLGVTILPLALILTATRMQRWWSRYSASRPIIVLLIAASIANQIYSFTLQFEQRGFNKKLNRWAASTGSDPVITRDWWLGGDCAIASYGKPWFIANRDGAVTDIIAGLRANGIRRCNYIERPPYVPEETWWSDGARPVGSDYFLAGRGDLRRTWLEIIPGGGVPPAVGEPERSRGG